MLSVGQCRKELNELRLSQRMLRDSKMPYHAEYIAHLERLERAFEKELEKAERREIKRPKLLEVRNNEI